MQASSRDRLFITALCLIGLTAGILGLFAWKTFRDLRPLPASLSFADSGVRKPQLLDRAGDPILISYENTWSVRTVPLHEIPELLRNAFIEAEDRRFFEHGGPDWSARLHALVQNVRVMRGVRGASTITEQVVRMIHQRPRTVWSRWLEGIEAARLERVFSKSEILEFYLNQVPYGHRRRGVVEAARFYFDRDPVTLNVRESLALAILVRAPSNLDIRKNPKSIDSRLLKLARHMREKGMLSESGYASALSEGFEVARSRGVIEAPQFAQYVFNSERPGSGDSAAVLTTSLDGGLQQKVARIVRSRLEGLVSNDVGDGAALVVDNVTGEVLAWVSESFAAGESGGWIDSVTSRRQPGSALKPFLYALAMEMGWTAATVIEDASLAEATGSGLHSFHNYGRTYYGPLRLRVALGNSLNTPAIRTIGFTGTERFLNWLRSLGISGLTKSADFYGHGLALGDGEVSLFELVQAYSVLARGGTFRPLCTLHRGGPPAADDRRVIGVGISAVIADILSDPQARRLEFGEGHLLRFPVRTAIKTGTSTDHRDCWAVGFTARHTAGVWMGNLDRRPTRGVTGAMGPALVLRAVFAELNREGDSGLSMEGSLPGSAGLQTAAICSVTGLLAGPGCPTMDEKFEAGTVPVAVCTLHSKPAIGPAASPEDVPRSVEAAEVPAGLNAGPSGSESVRILQPTPGLQIAVDPRIPRELQAFAFILSEKISPARVEWILNGRPVGETGRDERRFMWPLSRGEYTLLAKVWRGAGDDPVETPRVSFVVK